MLPKGEQIKLFNYDWVVQKSWYFLPNELVMFQVQIDVYKAIMRQDWIFYLARVQRAVLFNAKLLGAKDDT